MIFLYTIHLACQPSNHAVHANGAEFYFQAINAGSFRMGAPFSEPGYRHHETQHLVKLTHDFRIGLTEVTRSQWSALMSDFPTNPCTGEATSGSEQPVNCISWCEIVFFVNRLSVANGLTPAYSIHNRFHEKMNAIECNSEAVYIQWEPLADGYRLPSEAEWEYAARSGFATVYAGSSKANDVAWGEYSGRAKPQEVAQLQPNYWGLYDMSGNVWEWVWDHYDLYLPHRSVDPTGPVEDIDLDGRRVMRGGAFDSPSDDLRVANRGQASPALKNHTVGFRLAQTIFSQ